MWRKGFPLGPFVNVFTYFSPEATSTNQVGIMYLEELRFDFPALDWKLPPVCGCWPYEPFSDARSKLRHNED